jgi:hypothetical protein
VRGGSAICDAFNGFPSWHRSALRLTPLPAGPGALVPPLGRPDPTEVISRKQSPSVGLTTPLEIHDLSDGRAWLRYSRDHWSPRGRGPNTTIDRILRGAVLSVSRLSCPEFYAGEAGCAERC